MTLTIEAHLCAERRSYLVHFEGPEAEARAVRWIRERGDRYQCFPMDDREASDALLRACYPYDFETCPHGLSLALCADPLSHYPRGL